MASGSASHVGWRSGVAANRVGVIMAENSDKSWAARELAASGASLSEIATELARADPEAYLADVIDRMAKGHSINRIDELLPWN
jgi:hypothetical protein